ncbi:MlaD family protein [Oricola sp.]|uniref:MlaD family protein n=1 Tax=Oricola sp. TaxID=1979950 RepID=UPI0025EA0AB7|nr:MlaD family protein [Oricola sp.]MCI5077272.1 MlaD family protein [Oricola sp.]
METKANYVTVGAFTLLIFLAGFAIVYWVARVDTTGENVRLDVVIEGSVTGLGVGSLVKFNGIDVGKVTGLSFDKDNPRLVIARTTVKRGLPISKATKAVLGSTGLTGIAHIEFEGGDSDETSIFDLAEQRGDIATIKADPSAVANLLATAQDIFDRTDRILDNLETVVTEIRDPLQETLSGAASFSKALADNSDEINTFLKGAGDVGEALADVSAKLDGSLKRVESLLVAVEPEKLSSIIDNVDGFTNNLSGVSDKFEGVANNISSVAEDLQGVGSRLTTTIDKVDAVLGAVQPDKIAAAVENVASAGEAARASLAEVEKATKGLGERQEDIQQIISNTQQLAERLNAASVRIDGILAKTDSLLGSDEGESMMVELRATLKSFREAAETLNTRIDTISAGVERFSDQGLRDVQSLVNETRRSVTRIERAITDIERNPQRLIFGGDGDVKTYNGRQRR